MGGLNDREKIRIKKYRWRRGTGKTLSKADEIIAKAKADEIITKPNPTPEKKKPTTEKKVKPEKKAEPRKYELPETQTYRIYTGTVTKIKRKNKKPLRISYPVDYHLIVKEIAKQKSMTISEIYFMALEQYVGKKLDENEGIKVLESLAKEKKITVSRFEQFALKDFLLKSGKTLPNNQPKVKEKTKAKTAS